MRWRFPDSSDLLEVHEREATVEKIDAWWHAFERAAPEIEQVFSRKSELDLPAFMEEHLGAIDPVLMWEFGPGLDKPHRLVITPESRANRMPLVRAILARAPSMARFEFYEARLAEPMKQARATVQGRTDVDLDALRIAATPGANGRIDVRVAITDDAVDADTAMEAAFVAIETLLGEETLAHWIGDIEVTPRPAPSVWARITGRKGDWPAEFESPERLKTRVDDLIGRALDRLPAAPLSEAVLTTNGLVLKRDAPPGHPSGLCEGRDDLYVAVSVLPVEIAEAMQAPRFSSRRFSRSGDTFAYLKIDGIGGLEGSVYQDRGEIEDALDEALRSAKAGCRVGGGTGRRYSYIDLLLGDADVAVDVIRRVRSEGRIPKSTWLLFFDEELADEWVGIYPDTPPPPTTPE